MKRIMSLFFIVMFMIGTDTFLISPLLPTLQTVYSISTEISGWMVSAYALGYALFALIAGPISDGLDRKKVMLGGMSFFAISTFLCGLAPSFWWMITFRFCAGVSAAFVSPQIWASIPLLVPKEQIVKCIGIATAGLSLSQLLGLPIGAYLAADHYATPFFTIGICSAILVLFIYVTLPKLRPEQTEQQNKSIMNRYKGLLQERKASYSFFAYFLFQTGNFAAFSFFGVWLASQFGLQVSEVGSAMLILGLGNLTGNILGPKLVKKLGHAYSFYGGIILITILYVILPHLKQIQLVELFFFILFFITGILFVLMMSQLQHLSSSARGTGAALANSCMYIGQTIGAAVAGLLFATFHSFVAVGIFTTSCYVISLLVFRKSDRIELVEKKPMRKAVL